jgi:hypothetical protein
MAAALLLVGSGQLLSFLLLSDGVHGHGDKVAAARVPLPSKNILSVKGGNFIAAVYTVYTTDIISHDFRDTWREDIQTSGSNRSLGYELSKLVQNYS